MFKNEFFFGFTQPSVNWIGDSVRIHPWMLIIHRRLKEIRKSTPCPFCFRNYFVQPSFSLHFQSNFQDHLGVFRRDWEVANCKLIFGFEFRKHRNRSTAPNDPDFLVNFSSVSSLFSPPSRKFLRFEKKSCFRISHDRRLIGKHCTILMVIVGISGFQRRDTWNSVNWNFSSFLSSKLSVSVEESIRVSNDFGGRMRLSKMMRAKFLRRKLNTQTSNVTNSLDWY